MRFINSWLIITVMAVAAFFSYFTADIPLALAAKSIEFGPVFKFCTKYTNLGEADIWIAGSLVLTLVLWFINRKWAKIAFSFFLALLLSGLISDLLKFFFGRNRPVMIIDFDTYGFEFFHTKYYKTSFPSGHTTTVATLAAMCAYHFRKWAVPAVVFAGFIAFTRLVTLNHFLSDVLGGFIVGILCSMFVYYRMYLKVRKDG